MSIFEIIKQKSIPIAENLHWRVFGGEMSEEMRKFLGNLSWSFLGVFFSSFLLFVLNVIAGRILGPEGYGKYNLVLVYASLIVMLILFGLDIVSIKYITGAKEEESAKKYLSNSFWIVLFTSATVFIFGMLLHSEISILFRIDEKIILLSFFFAIALSLKNILDSFIRSLRYFKFQSFIKITESFLVVIFFVVFFFLFKQKSFEYYMYSLLIASFFISLSYFVKIFNKIVKWDGEKFRDIVPYLKATLTLLVINAIIGSVDKIFIGKFVGVRELGIYIAYITSTTLFSAQLVSIFDNVFSPMVSMIEKKDAIIRKIDKMAVVFFIPIVISFSFVSFFILKLFGSQFDINFLYIVIFSFLAYLQIFSSFYKNIVYSATDSYQKFKKLAYILPFFFLIAYTFSVVFNFRNLNCMVFIYACYMFLYSVLIRLSYKYEK